MRKLTVLICLFALFTSLSAQETTATTKKEKKIKSTHPTIEKVLNQPVLYKDRILLDFVSSIWLGLDKDKYPDVKQKAINFGFNGSVIFDIPVKKNAPFSFGVGLGVSNYNLYSNGIWGIGENYTTTLTKYPNNMDSVRTNKLSYTDLYIPIEFRYRHKSGFKIAVGVRVGLTVDLHSKYFGPALDGSQSKDLIKDYNIVNRTKIPVEVCFRTGWKFVGITASYMVTKMFEAEKGPQICPFSIGISLCPY